MLLPGSLPHDHFLAIYFSGGEVASHQRPLSLLVSLLLHAGNTWVVFFRAPTPGLRGKKRGCGRIGTGKSEELQQKRGTAEVRKGSSIPL